MKTLIITSLFITSCAVNPIAQVVTPDGTKITLSTGGSFFEKTKEESGMVQHGETALAYSKSGKNQVSGVTTSVAAWAAGKAFEYAANAKQSIEATKASSEVAKVTAKEATKQAGIAADVTKHAAEEATKQMMIPK